MDVKQALLDQRFRNKLPNSLQNDVTKFLSNPHCACNHPIYVKVIKEAADLLREYYPAKKVEEITAPTSKNNWTVFNCTIHDLQSKLQALGPGRKQVELARYQDQITVVINELDEF